MVKLLVISSVHYIYILRPYEVEQYIEKYEQNQNSWITNMTGQQSEQTGEILKTPRRTWYTARNPIREHTEQIFRTDLPTNVQHQIAQQYIDGYSSAMYKARLLRATLKKLRSEDEEKSS